MKASALWTVGVGGALAALSVGGPAAAQDAGFVEAAPAPHAAAPLTLTIRSRSDEPAPAWAPRRPDLAPQLKRRATVSYAISGSTAVFFDVRKDKRPGASDERTQDKRDWPAAHTRGGRGYMVGVRTRW